MDHGTHLSTDILTSAQTLWNYLKLDQPLKKSDVVIALGSHDLRTATYSAQLVLDGWAPLLVCSGGLGRLTSGVWQETEADRFAKAAVDTGFPIEKILLETRSTNTGENLTFSRSLCEEHTVPFQTILLVHKPYMERRVWAAASMLWPELEITISSPPIPFEKYPTKEISLELIIHIMVGDFQRILVYPEKGFAFAQHVPTEVMQAFDHLVKNGFTDQLV